MSTTWTQEQVLGLAPDANSAKNGKALAVPHKWLSLGCSEDALWGECKGSGKNPYQTQIDLTEPAFKCSCPSRKFPCKHGLGLFLIFASNKSTFTEATPPEWVSEWLNKRKEKQAKKTEAKAKKSPNKANQAKRAEERYNKVKAGIEDLELWLRDLVRQGLVTAQTQPYSFWDTAAARLVDAQASGMARIVREMGSIPHSGIGWEERLLAQLGRIYLLVEGFKRLQTLPPGMQADIRTQIGWTQNQEELLTKEGVRDEWLILGQRVEEQDNLKSQRIWLWSKQNQQAALILNYAYVSQSLDISLISGTCIDAELVFFESAYPLRAIVKNRHGIPSQINTISGYKGIAEMMAAYAQALSCNPWIEQFPVVIMDVIPFHEKGKWWIIDSEKKQLSVVSKFLECWELLAHSAGYPITLFGEWNAEQFLPLSVWTENQFFHF
ncbi:MAG: SWIM zinc finger family protein [Nostocaceae cyanobacterium]|nr:SWIM zinc finger family protein [Nostocaceae cyanobacterium]